MDKIDETIFNPDPALCTYYDILDQMPTGPNDERNHIGLSPISSPCRWDNEKECHFVVRTPSPWGVGLGTLGARRIPRFLEEQRTTQEDVAALLPIVEAERTQRTREGRPDDCNGNACYACRAVALRKAAQLPKETVDPVAQYLMRLVHSLTDDDPEARAEATSVLAKLPAELSETAERLKEYLLLRLRSSDG